MLESRLSGLVSSQSAFSAATSIELENLNEAVKSASMDLDDAMEKFGDKQQKDAQEARAMMSEAIADNRQQAKNAANFVASKVEAVNSRLTALDSALQAQRARITDEIKALDTRVSTQAIATEAAAKKELEVPNSYLH